MQPLKKMMWRICEAYCNRAGWATMIRGASPRRVTGMVQKTSFTSRSFQPGAKTTDNFLSAVGSTRVQGPVHLMQSDAKILHFPKIDED
jgi:hypothetical protein